MDKCMDICSVSILRFSSIDLHSRKERYNFNIEFQTSTSICKMMWILWLLKFRASACMFEINLTPIDVVFAVLLVKIACIIL